MEEREESRKQARRDRRHAVESAARSTPNFPKPIKLGEPRDGVARFAARVLGDYEAISGDIANNTHHLIGAERVPPTPDVQTPSHLGPESLFGSRAPRSESPRPPCVPSESLPAKTAVPAKAVPKLAKGAVPDAESRLEMVQVNTNAQVSHILQEMRLNSPLSALPSEPWSRALPEPVEVQSASRSVGPVVLEASDLRPGLEPVPAAECGAPVSCGKSTATLDHDLQLSDSSDDDDDARLVEPSLVVDLPQPDARSGLSTSGESSSSDSSDSESASEEERPSEEHLEESTQSWQLGRLYQPPRRTSSSGSSSPGTPFKAEDGKSVDSREARTPLSAGFAAPADGEDTISTTSKDVAAMQDEPLVGVDYDDEGRPHVLVRLDLSSLKEDKVSTTQPSPEEQRVAKKRQRRDSGPRPKKAKCEQSPTTSSSQHSTYGPASAPPALSCRMAAESSQSRSLGTQTVEDAHKEEAKHVYDFQERIMSIEELLNIAKQHKKRGDVLKQRQRFKEMVLAYFHAVCYFLLNNEAREQRLGTKDVREITSQYYSTLELCRYAYHFKFHDRSEGNFGGKLKILSYWCQALLRYRLFRLQLNEGIVLSHSINKMSAQVNAAASKSPQAGRHSGEPYSQSPTPSPASVGSVGSQGSNDSKTTSMSGMSLPSPGTTVTIPQHLHSQYMKYVRICDNVLLAQQLWDQAEANSRDGRDVIEFVGAIKRRCASDGFSLNSPLETLVCRILTGVELLHAALPRPTPSSRS